MRSQRSAGPIAAVLLSLALIAPASPDAGPEASQDTRRRLFLPAAGRDKILAEMRGMLSSMDGILKALTTGDMPAAEKSARGAGMAVAADVEPEIQKALPEAFLTLGTETHRGFDRLADRIQAGAVKNEVLKDLSGIISNCVACHATWRLDELR